MEDVSHYVEKSPDIVASWGRADRRATEDSVAGKLSFNLINQGREFSPENVASPIAGKVLPGTPVRLNVTDPATAGTTTLFLGPVDSLEVDPNAAGKDAAFSCLDGWGVPNDTKLSTTVYQGLRTGDLINVILDQLAWPAGMRAIDAGATVVPYWWLEGTDALTAVNDLVHSEGPPAIAFVRAGVFYFRDRHHRLLDTHSTVSQGSYTHLIPAGAVASIADTFTRTVSAGSWGTSDAGLAWSVVAGTASNFSVTSGSGRISVNAVNTEQVVVLPYRAVDVSVAATFTTAVAAATSAINGYVIVRRFDSNNQYQARLVFDTGSVLSVGLEKEVGGVTTTLVAPTPTGDTYATSVGYRLRCEVVGQTLRARAWPVSNPEPVGVWHVSVVDDDLPVGTSVGTSTVGVRALLSTGNTNTSPVVMTVDDVAVSPTDFKILKGSFQYNHGLNNIVNSATLEVSPRLPSDRQVVWSTDDQITLGSHETLVLTIAADNPFLDLQVPSALINFIEDGTFTRDYFLAQGAVTMTLDRTSGQSAQLTILAGLAGAILDDGVKVRGTPLLESPTRKFSTTDTSSVNTFGLNTWDGSAPWAGVYDAEALADRIVSVYSQARPSVSFDIATQVNPAHLTRALATQVSDRITVRNDELGMATDFMVEQVTHTIQQLGVIHRVTLGCEVVEPTQTANPFTFDVSGQGFDDGAFGMDGLTDPSAMFMFDVDGHGFDSGRFAT